MWQPAGMAVRGITAATFFVISHPLVPKDIVVRGFIIDSETGALEDVE